MKQMTAMGHSSGIGQIKLKATIDWNAMTSCVAHVRLSLAIHCSAEYATAT